MDAVQPNAGSAWRLIAACFGASWAYHVSSWRTLYSYYGADAAYYMSAPASWKPGAAAFLASLGLAGALFFIVKAAPAIGKRIGMRAAQLLFGAVLVVSAWKYSVFLVAMSDLSPGYGIAAYCSWFAVSVVLVFVFSNRPNACFAAAQSIALVFSPFVLLSSAQLGYWLAFPAEVHGQTLEADSKSSGAGGRRRVVWVLFDELDAEIAFSATPPVEMPSFARLRSEGYSHMDVEPTSLSTLTALPEQTTGRPVSFAQPIDAGTLRLDHDDSSSYWTSDATIFGWAAQRGLDVGITGSHHPYCRLFEDALTSCRMELLGSGGPGMLTSLAISKMPLAEAVAFQAANEWRLVASMVFLDLEAAPGTGSSGDERELRYVRVAQIEAFQSLRESALAQVGNPDLELVFVHFSIPHPLGIFDRTTGDYTASLSADYLGNLALADRTLGEIRKSIEAAGLSSRTALLVNSDHPFRKQWKSYARWSDELAGLVDKRPRATTPLFLYLPDAPTPEDYTGPLHSFVVPDLIELLLEGGSPTPQDWSRWMAAKPELLTNIR